MIIMMRVKIVLVSVSKNSENEDDAKIVRDKKIDFCFAVSDSELNLSETILEPSRAQVMFFNFVNEDSCVSVFVNEDSYNSVFLSTKTHDHDIR